MNKLFMIAMAVAAVGLSACTSTDSARVDQAPYSSLRTAGSQEAPAAHGDTVFHGRQGK